MTTAQFPDTFGEDTRPIELADVSKHYGSLTAVDSASFSARPGEFHALVGPNGSGKTTLGRLAVGLTRPSAGTVSAPTEDIGYVFQQPRYYPALSVRENVATFRRAVGESAAPRDWHDRVLDTLGLSAVADQPAGSLSGGFQKKLDIAIGVLRRPAYVWLDEPLAALDPVSVERVVNALETYVAAGGGVVLSTHIPSAFEAVLTHLTVCRDGRPIETHDLTDRDSRAVLDESYRDDR